MKQHNFKIREEDLKYRITLYDKLSLDYKYVYEEFDKQNPKLKEYRKVNFRSNKIRTKYGECYSIEFNVLKTL